MLRHRIVPDEQPRGERESVVVVRLLLLLFLGVVLPSRTDDGIGYKRKKKMRRARARDDDDDTILSGGGSQSSFVPLGIIIIKNHHFIATKRSISKRERKTYYPLFVAKAFLPAFVFSLAVVFPLISPSAWRRVVGP